MAKGKVYIIGAGPGSGGLVSVRGRGLLRRANCVLYDRLIGDELLNLVSKKAEKIYVGKEHTENSHRQKDINNLIIKKARIYKTIVRLKGGDPMIFGRATEEIKCLIKNKIDFEIIPGITAALAAAACAGIVLTDRNTASSVTFITGHTADGRETNIDFKNLAKLSGTIVFYMAVCHLNRICGELIKAGFSANTPAVVIANASLPNQKIVKGDVSDIAEKCSAENIQPPAIMIVGKNCISYSSAKSLFGRKILMTRDKSGNAEFAAKLAARGACAISCPTFKIQDLTGKKRFKQVLAKIKDFDWVFFTSPTGVKLFFSALERLDRDARVFAEAKIACIGSETANVLEDFGIKADFVPKKFTSNDFAKEFIKKYKPIGKTILLLRSALADTALTEKLKSAKANVETIPVYTAEKLKNDNLESVDWITFASSFAVDCFFEDFDSKDINKKTKIASIGAVTTDTLKKHGIKPTAEAKEHTINGLIEAMGKIK